MKRLCYLLLCLPLWLQAQAPLQVGISSPLGPISWTYVPHWGYVVSTSASCGASVHVVDTTGTQRLQAGLGEVIAEQFEAQGDTLWAYGPLLQDDQPVNMTGYVAIDRSGNRIIDERIEIGYREDFDCPPPTYCSEFAAARQDSLLYYLQWGQIFKMNIKTHQLIGQRVLPAFARSLLVWQDSLVFITNEGVFVQDTALAFSRQASAVVCDHIWQQAGAIYGKAGTTLFKLNAAFEAAHTQDLSSLLHSILHVATDGNEICLLATDHANDTVLLVLDATSLSPKRWLYPPISGGRYAVGKAGSWGMGGLMPGLGLMISDNLGRWELPRQRVAVVGDSSFLTGGYFVTDIPRVGKLWPLTIRVALRIQNLGPDTLRYVYILSKESNGVNCASWHNFTEVDNLSLAPGDTTSVYMSIGSTPSGIEGVPKAIPLSIYLRNPNHELIEEVGEVAYTATYQYTARDAAHSLLAQVTAYPNPTTDLLRLTLPPTLPAVAYTVQDLQGRTLATGQASTGTALPTAQLAPGLYVLRLHTPEGAAHSLRFVKQ